MDIYDDCNAIMIYTISYYWLIEFLESIVIAALVKSKRLCRRINLTQEALL